ncbi:hypothetical protein HK100_011104 [Physocladia obscura]|uniref:Uncharacterized protein n=1 Tax=Physocladia obscura TaxID=109957 RepID=A0AAD5T8R5_9FUNG|nr:hypothetical protein HK100_011104 [Physocladia obscura]
MAVESESQLKKVEKQVSALEKQLQQKVQALEETTTDYSNETSEAHQKMYELEEKLLNLSHKLETALTEVNSVKKENQLLRDKNIELQSQQTQHNTSSTRKLSWILNSLHSFIGTCTTQLRLPAEISKLLEDCVNSVIEFGDKSEDEYDWKLSPFMIFINEKSLILTDHQSRFEKDKLELIKRLESQNFELEQFKRDLQLKETSLQYSERERNKQQQNFEQADSRHMFLESELSECKKALTTSDRRLKKLQTAFEELEKTHSKTESDLSATQTDCQTLVARISAITYELETTKKTHGAALMDETIFVKLQNTVREKSELLERMEIEYRKVAAAYGVVDSEARRHKDVIAALELQKSHLTQELDNSNERSGEQEQEIEDLRMQEEFLKTRLAVFESESLSPSAVIAAETTGNTLLSEVEDRRIRSEKKFTEMVINQRRMFKEMQILKKEKKDLKAQLAMMDSNSKSMSEEQIKNQLAAMSQIISGFKQRAVDAANTLSSPSSDGEKICADSYDLLHLELSEKILENEVLRNENRSLRIISLNEMSKARTAEYSLNQNSRKVQQAESTISTLKDKLKAKDASNLSEKDYPLNDIGDNYSKNEEEEKDNEIPKETKPRQDMNLPLLSSGIANTNRTMLHALKLPSNGTRREKAAQKFKEVDIKNDETKNPNECKTQ